MRKISCIIAMACMLYSSIVMSSDNSDINLSAVDRYQTFLAAKIDHYSANVDRFLSDTPPEKYQHTPDSEGSFKIIQSYNDSGYDYDIDVNLSVDLPETEKQYKLIIESDPPEEKNIEEKANPNSTTSQNKKDKGIDVSIQKDSNEFVKWDTNYGFGVKTNLPMDVFLRGTMERKFSIGQSWFIRLDERLTYFIKNGLYNTSSLSFEKNIDKTNSFSASTILKWDENEDRLGFAEVLTLKRELSGLRTEAFELGIIGKSYTHQKVNTGYLAYSYRQPFHQDWAFFKVIPELEFKRENDFEATPAFTLELEFVLD